MNLNECDTRRSAGSTGTRRSAYVFVQFLTSRVGHDTKSFHHRTAGNWSNYDSKFSVSAVTLSHKRPVGWHHDITSYKRPHQLKCFYVTAPLVRTGRNEIPAVQIRLISCWLVCWRSTDPMHVDIACTNSSNPAGMSSCMARRTCVRRWTAEWEPQISIFKTLVIWGARIADSFTVSLLGILLYKCFWLDRLSQKMNCQQFW